MNNYEKTHITLQIHDLNGLFINFQTIFGLVYIFCVCADSTSCEAPYLNILKNFFTMWFSCKFWIHCIGLVKGLIVGVMFVTSYVSTQMNVRESLSLSIWTLFCISDWCCVTTHCMDMVL